MGRSFGQTAWKLISLGLFNQSCAGSSFCGCLGRSPELGLGPGSTADFVIFNARCFSELLARPQCDRIVVRSCKAHSKMDTLFLVDKDLPDYSELDDLVATKTEVDSSVLLHKKDA